MLYPAFLAVFNQKALSPVGEAARTAHTPSRNTEATLGSDLCLIPSLKKKTKNTAFYSAATEPWLVSTTWLTTHNMVTKQPLLQHNPDQIESLDR